MQQGQEGHRNRLFVFGSVVLSRAVYALCWFNLAAAFPIMSTQFHYSVAGLSLLTASFLIGAGIFQIPAGMFSAARGAAKTTLIALASVAAVSGASALSGQFDYQIAMRFLTGVAAAFYFAPAMVVASSTIGREKSGLAIGIYNGAFNVGAGSALLFFTPISALIDWRLPFVITSVLTFGALVENIFAFRGLKFKLNSSFSKAKRTLASRDLWLITSAMLGVNAAYYVATQFSVSYAENYLLLTPLLAGGISSLILYGAMVGGPLGGWLSDKMGNRRHFMVLVGGAVGLTVALFAFRNSYVVWPASFLFGIAFSAAYSNSYAYSTEIRGTEIEYAPLAVAFLNGSGMADGSIAAPLFALLVLGSGYGIAWVALAAAAFLFSPLILFSRREPVASRAIK